MVDLLPSPPHPSLQHSSLSVDQVEALRSSTSLALVHLEEMLNMLHWGGEGAVAGWPTFLSSYQKMQRLLAQLNHHLSVGPSSLDRHDGLAGPSIPSSTSRGTVLNRHLVHPYLPADAAAEPWLQTLLMNEPSVPSTSSPIERSSAMGTIEEHEARRQRASRICSLLVEQHDWRGRVGAVEDEDGDDEDEAEDGEDDEDEEDEEEDGTEKTDGAMDKGNKTQDGSQPSGNEAKSGEQAMHAADEEADAEGEEEGDQESDTAGAGEESKSKEDTVPMDSEMVDVKEDTDEDDEDEDDDIFGDKDDEMSNM